MRFVDSAEWLVLRAIHLHLAAAAESAIQELHSNHVTTGLGSTLEFLDFELRVLAAIVDTRKELDGSVVLRLENEVHAVFAALEGLLKVDISSLLRDAGRAIEEGHSQAWTPGPVDSLPYQSLDNQDQCGAVVSVLESFNKRMDPYFRDSSQHSNPSTGPPESIMRRFDPTHERDLNSMFNTIEKQLSLCGDSSRHRMFLQLAGQVWQDHGSKPKSLYISSCKVETALQEIEFWDTILNSRLGNGPNEHRNSCTELPDLCGQIKQSLCYDELLKLRRLDQVLYRIVSSGERTRQQNGMPIISVGRLIEEELLSPVSVDRVQTHSFTVSEKRKLTLDLAWCLVQLLNCKWTDQSWSVDDMFLLATSSETSTSFIRGPSPYIACKGMDTPFTDEKYACPDSLGDSIFLSFGKLLVEVETGRKVIPTERTKLGDPSLWLTIDRVLEEGRMPSACGDYLQAVDNCLQLHMQYLGQDTTAKADEWRQEIHDQIVVNLEKNFGHYRNTSFKRRRGVSDMHHGSGSKASSSNALSLPNPVEASSNRDSIEHSPARNSEDVSPNFSSSQNEASDRPHVRKRARLQNMSSSVQSATIGICEVRRSSRLADRTCSTGSVSMFDRRPETSIADLRAGAGDGSFDGNSFSVPSTSLGLSHSDTYQRLLKVWDYFDFKKKHDRPVKVAVLDTGLDISHPYLKNPRLKAFEYGKPVWADLQEPSQHGRIKACADFTGSGQIAGKDEMIDLDGHGTQVAELILRFAPRSELYIARICEGEQSRGMPSPSAPTDNPIKKPQPHIVAKAIDWALEQKVDIINMSFGFRDIHMDVKAALNRAVHGSKVLVFAAMSNDGNNSRNAAWPARDWNLSIGVHSCDPWGLKTSGFTPRYVDGCLNFMFVGEEVITLWPEAKGGGFRLDYGTSFAAPAVAAMAALILGFARQHMCKQEREDAIAKKVINLDELCELGGMAKVLKRISEEDQMRRYIYIHPSMLWRDFRQGHVENKSRARQHAWDVIIESLKQ